MKIYTDGACSGNPGVGGWGAVILMPNEQIEISGNKLRTTNNEMELTAVLEGLKKAKTLLSERNETATNIEVFSDSSYVVNMFSQGWVYNWIRHNWRKSDGNPVLNKEIIEEIYTLTNEFTVTFTKVKGHDGDKYNEICDQLAVRARLSIDDEESGTFETVKQISGKLGYTKCLNCGSEDISKKEIEMSNIPFTLYICNKCNNAQLFKK